MSQQYENFLGRLRLFLNARGISYCILPDQPLIGLFSEANRETSVCTCVCFRINKNYTLTVGSNIWSLQTFLIYLSSDPDLSQFPTPGPEKRPNMLNALRVMNDTINEQELERFLKDQEIKYKKINLSQTFQFTRKDMREDKLTISRDFGYWELWEGKNIKKISHFELFNYLAEN